MALILVIDDEFELRAGLVTGLQRAGFDVAEAEDGSEGLDLIRQLRPDAVVCDINMPGLRGEEVLAKVRQDMPDLARMPFLFLTALADRDQLIAGHQLGADDYLTKPVDLDVLAAVIHRHLAQAQRWSDVSAAALQVEREAMIESLAAQTRLSFLSGADVLNYLADGIFLLDPDGKIDFANRAARRILRQNDGLQLNNGTLIGHRPADSRRIADLIGNPASASSAQHISLERPSLKRPYLLRACRLDSTADHDQSQRTALFVTDPELPRRPSEPALIQLFGLTPTEARIAADLAVGWSVEDCASTRGISRNTVHHHLRALFRKTDTTRQGELVARVLGSVGVDSVTAGSHDRQS